jgi:glutamyl/glutaminyl-tRNA synthetase
LEVALQSVAKACGVKNGVLVHPTRLACTGTTIGPSLYNLLEVLGRERVLRRLDAALRLAEDGG